MTNSQFYFIGRFISIFTMGWVIGLKEPWKLLVVLICTLVWQILQIKESQEEKQKALDEIRAKFVHENFRR